MLTENPPSKTSRIPEIIENPPILIPMTQNISIPWPIVNSNDNTPSKTNKIPEIIENPPLLMQLQHHRNLNAKINMANDNKSKGMLLLIRLSHLYMLLF